jgi:RHS repeat-associated protein
MAGISSKAAGKLENKYKFNGGNELQHQEFSDGSGLEMYDAVHRMYDPQLGMFHQIDELAQLDFDISPYAFANNNPILINDPTGLIGDSTGKKGEVWHGLQDVTVTAKAKLDTKNGQVLPPQSSIWDLIFGQRTFTGHWKLGDTWYRTNWLVDNKGYLTNKTAPNEFVFTAPIGDAPVNLKAVFNIKNFIKSRYLIYKYTKNGLPYLGKALGSLAARYGSEANVERLGIEVFEGLNNIPNNAVALGVE